MEYTELDIRIKEVNPFSDILVAKLNEIEFESFIEDENGVKAYVQTQLLNKDAVTDPLINVFDFICRDDPLGTPIVFVSTADAVKFPTTLTDSDEAFIIGLPLTKRDILFTLFKFKPFGSLPLNCIPFTFYFFMILLILKQQHQQNLLMMMLLI